MSKNRFKLFLQLLLFSTAVSASMGFVIYALQGEPEWFSRLFLCITCLGFLSVGWET